MLKNFKILTVTHRKTNLKEIGQFVVSNADNTDVAIRLEELKQQFELDELMYVPTCNRVMYFFHTLAEVDADWKEQFFKAVNPNLEVSGEYLNEHLIYLEGHDAIKHLFEVAASVDSMVIGEREILRQLREGFEQSKKWGLTGDNIRLAMKTTVEAAKEVYAQTRIGEKPISVASLAIHQLLATNLPKDGRILMIGAGQTNSLVAKFLKKHQFNNITVVNRTLERAEQLAKFLEGKAIPFDALHMYQEGFDALIVCTGATKAIITKEIYTQLLNGETTRKVVVDLSIPNNVAKEVVDAFDLHYIEIEGLRNLSEQNKDFRRQEITKVKKLLMVRLAEFETIFRQRKITRALRHVPTEIKAVKEKAINEIFKKQLADLDDDTLQLVNEMMNYMERRCISIPMQAAKEAVG